MSIKIKTDKRNTNKHTEKGLGLLDKSLKTVGIIESYTVSNDGVVISGNARHEAISENFTKPPIVIETDGTEPIIIKRTDIESYTKKFHEASILANTTAHHNYNLDTTEIEVIAMEFDLEIEELGVEIEELVMDGVEPEMNQQRYSDKNKEIDVNDFANKMTIKLEYTEEDYHKVKEALSRIAQTPEAAIFKLLNLDENE